MPDMRGCFMSVSMLHTLSLKAAATAYVWLYRMLQEHPTAHAGSMHVVQGLCMRISGMQCQLLQLVVLFLALAVE